MQLFTTAQAAEKLGVSEGRIRFFIMKGRLKAEKFGKANAILDSELQRFQDEGRLKRGRKKKSGKKNEKD